MIDNKKNPELPAVRNFFWIPPYALEVMNPYNLIFIKQSMSYHQSNLNNRIQKCVILLNKMIQHTLLRKLMPFQNKKSQYMHAYF